MHIILKNNLHKSNSHRKQIFPRSTSKIFQIFFPQQSCKQDQILFFSQVTGGLVQADGEIFFHQDIQGSRFLPVYCPASFGWATGPICIVQTRSFSCYYPEPQMKEPQTGAGDCANLDITQEMCIYMCVCESLPFIPHGLSSHINCQGKLGNVISSWIAVYVDRGRIWFRGTISTLQKSIKYSTEFFQRILQIS